MTVSGFLCVRHFMHASEYSASHARTNAELEQLRSRLLSRMTLRP